MTGIASVTKASRGIQGVDDGGHAVARPDGPVGITRRRLLVAGGLLAEVVAVAACDSGRSADPDVSRSGSTATTSGGVITGEFPAGVQVYGPEDGLAVLGLHPWWGISPGVLAWKDILVAAAARVVLPDLYAGRVVDTVDEAEALSNAIDDTEAFGMLDACAERLDSTGRPWAAVGWSMGAYHASLMMNRGAHAPSRAVLFYGAATLTGASRTEAVQLHIAPNDEYFTDREIVAAVAGFARAGIAVERYDYPGLRHWFAEVGSPAYDDEGTRIATERALTFLGL